MFTGLVETVGKIKSVKQTADTWLIDISAPEIASELKKGDSVSVSGACLTVTDFDLAGFRAEMMEETKQRTKLGSLKSGDLVNLERAMSAGSRFDGHIVSGHVDGVGRVAKIENSGRTKKVFFAANADIISGIVSKGSVAVDGVSLTVIGVSDNEFSVGLIPETLAQTSLSALVQGSAVNLETDIIGKYVAKFLEKRFGQDSLEKPKENITWQKLADSGWL
ncbi:MAG: riboflavin synthase [Synergistaceae bacterium]|nr:riboflavin synthase [Synergistaceae bacterium]